MAVLDHGAPGDGPTVPPPLGAIANPARPTAAEEARTIVAATNVATLASLTTAGDPWASMVTYGLLGGSPVLCVSDMAEHGRNLAADARASLAVVTPNPPADPLASARVTLAGVVERPTGAELDDARAAHLAAVRAARTYIDFSDFAIWVLRVQRVRWVGGYGRMDSATGEDYAAAEPDPVSPQSEGAIA
ncbi:MAG: pyridoxamine 5'-phosphate oxidase family protein, partial [Aldersonia sp.]|nr:pyridoxamine 5'-phosphate oxidase family protein [Aldersonia sp.]